MTVISRGGMEMRLFITAQAACATVALMLVGAASGCASSVAPPPAGNRPSGAAVAVPADAASPIPGTDPAIQRWFLGNGAAKVAFNNALLRAERGVAGGAASECRPLSAAIQVIDRALPKLAAASPAGQKLAAAIQPVLTTFNTAATACLAKDFAAATRSLDVGITQQADAQAAVDEILDGDR